MNPRHKAFQTAAMRRRLQPIVWDIDNVEVQLIATASIDLIADLLDTIQKEQPEGTTVMQGVALRRKAMLDVMVKFVEPEDVDAFLGLGDDLDVHLVGQLAEELIAEYSGQGNPTQPSSSPTGADESGTALTDGAVPEA